MSDSKPLAGKTAIVTGASSGIGRAIAEHLGGAGAHVYLTGRTASLMDECKTHIEQQGGKAEVVTADIRDITQVQDLINQAVEVNRSPRHHGQQCRSGIPSKNNAGRSRKLANNA